MEFLAQSMHDFLGGGGGVSSTPWCWGFACHWSLGFRNFSEIRSFRYVTEVTGDQDAFSAALPARASGLSFPGVPAWPFTNKTSADRPSSRIILATIF
jgi:hypothetical protein